MRKSGRFNEVDNVWDEAGILPMAIRLRKAGKCPPEIEKLYGEIIISLVLMATRLLPKKEPKYEKHLSAMMDYDVQMKMVAVSLQVAETKADTTKNPRAVANYLVKSVQNRLKNWVRDTTNRKVKAEMVTESDLEFDIAEYGETACDLEGRKVYREKDMKNINNKPGDNDE